MAATPPSTATNALDEAWWRTSVAADVALPAELTPLLLTIDVAKRLEVRTSRPGAVDEETWTPNVGLHAARAFKRGETVFAELAVAHGNPAALASEELFRSRLCLAGALAAPDRACALVRLAASLLPLVARSKPLPSDTRSHLLWTLFRTRSALMPVVNSARPDAPSWACLGPRTALLSHDCSANVVCVCMHEKAHGSMGINWVATRDIAQGELLTRCFVTPLAPRRERHEALADRFRDTVAPLCPCSITRPVDVMTALVCACGEGIMSPQGGDDANAECAACHAVVSVDARTHACATAAGASTASPMTMLALLTSSRVHATDGACISLLRAAVRDACAAMRKKASPPLSAADCALVWSTFTAIATGSARQHVPLPDLLHLACDVAFVMGAHADASPDAARHSSEAYAVAASVCELAPGLTTRQEVELLRTYIPKPPRTLAEACSADKLVWLTRSAEW